MPGVRFTLPQVKQKPDTRPSSCTCCAGVAFHKHGQARAIMKKLPCLVPVLSKLHTAFGTVTSLAQNSTSVRFLLQYTKTRINGGSSFSEVGASHSTVPRRYYAREMDCRSSRDEDVVPAGTVIRYCYYDTCEGFLCASSPL